MKSELMTARKALPLRVLSAYGDKSNDKEFSVSTSMGEEGASKLVTLKFVPSSSENCSKTWMLLVPVAVTLR
jgi:hypothetical protein